MAPQTPTPSPPPPSGGSVRSNRTITTAANRPAARHTGNETAAVGISSGLSVEAADAAGDADGGGAGPQSNPESSGCGRGPAAGSGNAGHPTYLEDHVARMQAEIERTTRRLEIEKRRLHELGESSRKAQHEFQDKRFRYSFNKAGAQEERLKAENNVLLLENRLSQALCKLNSGSDDVNKLKAMIDKHRKDRLAMEKVYRHVHRELAHHTEHLTLAKEKVAQLQEWEHQSTRRMDELNKAKEHEREAFKQHCLTMQKELREQDRQIKEFDIRTHRESSTQRTQMKGSPYSLAEEEHTFNPESLMKLIFKTALLNAVHRHNIRQYKHKISVFEKAMESIKTSTGISDAEEIVSIFSQLEERNYSVMTYVNNINVELEYLETKKRQLEMHVQQQAHHDATAQRFTDETLRDVAAQISNTLLATGGKNALIHRQLQGLQQSHEMLEATTALIRSCWKGPQTREEPPPRDPAPFGPDGQRRDLLPMLWFIQKFFETHTDLLHEAKNDSCTTDAISAARAWASSYASAAAAAQGVASGVHATGGGTHATLPVVLPSSIRHTSLNSPYTSHGPGDSVAARLSEKGGTSGTSSQGGVPVSGTVYVRGRSSPVGFGATAGGGVGSGAPGSWGSRTAGHSTGSPTRGNDPCSGGGANSRKTTCPVPGSRSSSRSHAPAVELRPASSEMQGYGRRHLFDQVMEKIGRGRRSPAQSYQRPLSAVTSSMTTAAAAAGAAGACSDEAATGACESGTTQRCATADSCTETAAEASGGVQATGVDTVTSGGPGESAEKLDHGARTKAPSESRKTPSEEEEDEDRELDSGDERGLIPGDVVPLSSEELRERTIHLFNRMRKKKAAAEGNTQSLPLYLPEKRCLLASPGARDDISDSQMPGSLSGAAPSQQLAPDALATAALLASMTEQRAVDEEQEGASKREPEAGGVAGSDERAAGDEAAGDGAGGSGVEDYPPALGGRRKTDTAEGGGSTAPAEEGSHQSRRFSRGMSINSRENGKTLQKKKTLPRLFRQPARVLFGRQKERQNSRTDAADVMPGFSPASPSRSSLVVQSQQQQQQQKQSLQHQQQIHHTSDAEKKSLTTLKRDTSLWGRRKSTKQLADRSGPRGTARSTYELQGQLPQLSQPQQQQNERHRYAPSFRSWTGKQRKSSDIPELKMQQQQQHQVADSTETGEKRNGEREQHEKDRDGGEPQKDQESGQTNSQPVNDAETREVLQQRFQRQRRQELDELGAEEQEQQQQFQEPHYSSKQHDYAQQQATEKSVAPKGPAKCSITEEERMCQSHPEALQRDGEKQEGPQSDQKYMKWTDSPDPHGQGKSDASYTEGSAYSKFRVPGDTKEMNLGHGCHHSLLKMPEGQDNQPLKTARISETSVADHPGEEVIDARMPEGTIEEQQIGGQERCGCMEQQLHSVCKEQNTYSGAQQQQPSLMEPVKEIPSSLSVVLRQIPANSLEHREDKACLVQQSLTEEHSPSGLVRFYGLPEATHEETAIPHEAVDLVRQGFHPMGEERIAALARQADAGDPATREHDTRNSERMQQTNPVTLEKVKEEGVGECVSSKSSGATGSNNEPASNVDSSSRSNGSSSSGLQSIPFDLGKRKSATALAALWERCETVAAEEAAATSQREQIHQRTRQTSESDSSPDGLDNISSQSYASSKETKENKKLDVCTEYLQHRTDSATATEAARQNLLSIMEKALVQLDSFDEAQVPREEHEAHLKTEREQKSGANAAGSSGKSFYNSSPFSFLPGNSAWNLGGSISSSSPARANSASGLATVSDPGSQAAGPVLPARLRGTSAATIAGTPQTANVDGDEAAGEESTEKSRPDVDSSTAKAENLQQPSQEQRQEAADPAHTTGDAPNTRSAEGPPEYGQIPERVGSDALPPRPRSGPPGQVSASATSPASSPGSNQGRGLSAVGLGTSMQTGSPARPRSPLPATVAAAAFHALRTATLSSSTVGAEPGSTGISATMPKRRPGSAAEGMERRFSAVPAGSTGSRVNSAEPTLSGRTARDTTGPGGAALLSRAPATASGSSASSAPVSAATCHTATRADGLIALSQAAASSDVDGSVTVPPIAASVAAAGAAVDEVTAAACVPLGTAPVPRTPTTALQASCSPVPQGGTFTATAEASSTCNRHTVAGGSVALRQQQEMRGDPGTTAIDSAVPLVGRGTQKLVLDDGNAFQNSRYFSRATEAPTQQRRLLLQQLQVTEPGDGIKSSSNRPPEGCPLSSASRSGKEMKEPTALPAGTEGAAYPNASTTGEAVLDGSVLPGAWEVDQTVQNIQNLENTLATGFLDTSCRPCTAPPGAAREPPASLPAGTASVAGSSAITPKVAGDARQFLRSSLSPSSSNAGTRPQSSRLLGRGGSGAAPQPRERVAAAAAALAASSGSTVGRPATASPSGTLTPAAAALYRKNISYAGAGVKTGSLSPATLALLRQRSRMSDSEIYNPILGAALNAGAGPNVLTAPSGGSATPSVTAAAGEGVQSENPAYRRPSSPTAVLAAIAAGAILNSSPSSPAQQGTSGSRLYSPQQTLWRPASPEKQYASVNQHEIDHQVQMQPKEDQQAQQRDQQQEQQQEPQQELQRRPVESSVPTRRNRDVYGGGATTSAAAAGPGGNQGATCLPVISQPGSPSATCGASIDQFSTWPPAVAAHQDKDKHEEGNPSDKNSAAGHSQNIIGPTENTAPSSVNRAGVAASATVAAAAPESALQQEGGPPSQAEIEAQHGGEESRELVHKQLQQTPLEPDIERRQVSQSSPGKSGGMSSAAEERKDLPWEEENKRMHQHSGAEQVQRDTQGSSREYNAIGHVGETLNTLLSAQHPDGNMAASAPLDNNEEWQHGEPRGGFSHRGMPAEAATSGNALQVAGQRQNLEDFKGNECPTAAGAVGRYSPIDTTGATDGISDANLTTPSNQVSPEIGEQRASMACDAVPTSSADANTTNNSDVFRRTSAGAGGLPRPSTAFSATSVALAPPTQSDEHKRPASVGSKHVSLNVQEDQGHEDEKEHFEQQQHPYWQYPQQPPYGQQRRSRQSQYNRRSHMSLLSSNRRSTRLSNAELFQFSPPDLQPPEKDSPPGTPPSSSSSRPQTAPNPAAEEPAAEEAFSAVVEGSRFVARVSRVERLAPQQLTKIDEEE